MMAQRRLLEAETTPRVSLHPENAGHQPLCQRKKQRDAERKKRQAGKLQMR